MKPVDWIGELLFPGRCPVCDKALPMGRKICPACEKKLVPIQEPRCCRCGKPLRDEREEYCGQCRRERHIYDRGLAVFPYNSIKASLYRFKYQGRREYAEEYGILTARYLGRQILAWQPEGLVPIPLHPKRQRKRGYNQARLLAESLGRQLGIPVYADLLIRSKNTAPLKRMDAAERQNNLKRAFKMRPDEVKLNTIILIDDIYTTGSTMDAAAAVCREAGVRRIYFVTLAVGEES